ISRAWSLELARQARRRDLRGSTQCSLSLKIPCTKQEESDCEKDSNEQSTHRKFAECRACRLGEVVVAHRILPWDVSHQANQEQQERKGGGANGEADRQRKVGRGDVRL